MRHRLGRTQYKWYNSVQIDLIDNQSSTLHKTRIAIFWKWRMQYYFDYWMRHISGGHSRAILWQSHDCVSMLAVCRLIDNNTWIHFIIVLLTASHISMNLNLWHSRKKPFSFGKSVRSKTKSKSWVDEDDELRNSRLDTEQRSGYVGPQIGMNPTFLRTSVHFTSIL